MAKPACRILVVNDESLVLREFVKGLNAAARTLDNPLGISFTGVITAKEALGVIERDGDLQAVLVDDTLYTLKNGRQSKAQMSALELVQRITRFRPELDVYILIAQEKEDDVVDVRLEEVEPMAYRFLLSFAKDNALKVRDGRIEERTKLAELQRVGDTA